MLGFFETGIVLLLLAWIAWSAANVFVKAKVAEALMKDPKPYEVLSSDYEKTLLILGDSTGVGIGADLPEDTVAGRLTEHLKATYVENQAKSGAAVEDLSTQIQHVRLTHYDFILIQIGGNDILAFHDAKKTAKKLDRLLGMLPDAEKVVVMSAGNIGGATIIPRFIRPFYTYANLAYHVEFQKVVKGRGMTYVNLYRKPKEDDFIKYPEKYLAEDGLHPSSEGYGLWFEALKASM